MMEQNERVAVKELMKSKDFELFIRYVFRETSMLSGIFTKDTNEAFTAIGAQQVGMTLLHDLSDLNQEYVAKIMSRGNNEE